MMALVFTAIAAQPTPRVSLEGCTIVTSAFQPTSIARAVSDLRERLDPGHLVPVRTHLPEGTGPAIVVGADAAQRAGIELPPADALGPEGYVLRVTRRNGRRFVLAAGATPKGTRHAVLALRAEIHAEGNARYVAADLDRTTRPAYAVRGMHLNGWPMHRPYSFRSWTEDDWWRYIDMLAQMGANLVYLWPFMDIMPVPLSIEDEEYLQEFRRVVDYAQRQHGMEVWMMQSANRVARDNCGVADPRHRPYWRPSQADRDPADPAEFAAVMESREAFYRIVNNVDGVCTIDSDPGGWLGSPLSDYMKILKGCRALLDEHNIHGRDAKIINWLWTGWGHRLEIPGNLPVIADTVRAMKAEMPEPWRLIAGTEVYLPICQAEGVLDHTVYVPYGAIEGEPSYPWTNVGLGGIDGLFAGAAKYPGLLGVMGNAQCPLLQFPRVRAFLELAWDPNAAERGEGERLLGMSRELYGEQAELIAECFAAVGTGGLERVEALENRLDELIQSSGLGRPGVLGQSLFPDSGFVARALLMQLQLRLAAERLYRGVDAGADPAECAGLVAALLDAYLSWDGAHGWHELWGPGPWQLGNLPADPRFVTALAHLRRTLGDDGSVNAFFDEVGRTLSVGRDAAGVAASAIEPMRSRVLSVPLLSPNPAREATVTASVVADAAKYPPEHAVDGDIATLYWPGVLVHDNEEWFEIAWPEPRTLGRVDAYFLRHESMWHRTIHLQRQAAGGAWEDMATATPTDTGGHALARFELPTPVTAGRIRLVNLLDLFEVEVLE